MFQSDDFDDIIADQNIDIFGKISELKSHAENHEENSKTEISEGTANSLMVRLYDQENTKLIRNVMLHNEAPNRAKRKRKFPGPAGLLPENMEENPVEKLKNIPLSQSFPNSQSLVLNLVFEEAPWLAMLKENIGIGSTTISDIKRRETEYKTVGRKVTSMTGVIQSIDRTLPDPLLVLRDQTGEIQCTLHREVWEHLACHLVPHHSVMVLKNTTIFTAGTAFKKIYLNITNNNISSVYCDEDNVYSVNPNVLKSSRVHIPKEYSQETITVADSRVIILKNTYLHKECVSIKGTTKYFVF